MSKTIEELTDEELDLLIAQKEEYMFYQEMADDFYYTNGKRGYDLRELEAYKAEKERRKRGENAKS